MPVGIEVKGTEELREGLQYMSKSVKDLREPFREIVKTFEGQMEDQFRTEKGWKPLSPYTIREKARLGFPLDILVRTERLKRSLTGKTKDTIRKIENDSLFLGTTVPYAKFHQEGTSRVPQRMIIREEMFPPYLVIIDKWYEGVMEKHFKE